MGEQQARHSGRTRPEDVDPDPRLVGETMVDDRPRCSECGDVIGVIERLVALIDGEAHATSIAAQPDIRLARGALYHQACYANR
jgi:hypothetical protein